MYFLGIDGGGTKTTCLVTDEGLNEVYRTVGSSINFYSEGLDNARRNMKAMLDEISENTGISHFSGVCVGSSALFTRADEKTMSDFCDEIFDCDNIIMDSDLFIALKASEKENSVVVIAGTGSMAAGLTRDGSVITKGGFGYILGDEGSGYRIALDGIREAVRSLDGTGKKTVLGVMLLEFSGVKTAAELVDVFYSPEKDRKTLASFTSFVIKAAENGDETALSIIQHQAKLLSETVAALIKEMPEKPFVSLYGGVFQHSELYASYFKGLIKDICIGCEILSKEPVFGAAVAAREISL